MTIVSIHTHTKPSVADALCCSFCGKTAAEVRHLIIGPLVLICDECVDCSAQIIAGLDRDRLQQELSSTVTGEQE